MLVSTKKKGDLNEYNFFFCFEGYFLVAFEDLHIFIQKLWASQMFLKIRVLSFLIQKARMYQHNNTIFWEMTRAELFDERLESLAFAREPTSTQNVSSINHGNEHYTFTISTILPNHGGLDGKGMIL